MIDSNWTNETQVAIADLDKDGWLDVILTGEESRHGIAWFKNPGIDSISGWNRHQVVTHWEGLHSLQIVDFDKDGDLDIFTAEMHHTKTKRVAIFENKNNDWIPHLISDVGSHKAKVCDIDNDGDDTQPRIWLNPNNKKLTLDQ